MSRWTKIVTADTITGRYIDEISCVGDSCTYSPNPNDHPQGILLHELSDVQFGSITMAHSLDGLVIRDCENIYIDQIYVHDIAGDFVNILSSFAKSNITIRKLTVDTHKGVIPYNVRHPDVLQLSPIKGNEVISNVDIHEIFVNVDTEGVQGISGFDGLYKNINIGDWACEMNLETNQHGISFTCLQDSLVGCSGGFVTSKTGRFAPGVIVDDRKKSGYGSSNITIAEGFTTDSRILNF